MRPTPHREVTCLRPRSVPSLFRGPLHPRVHPGDVRARQRVPVLRTPGQDPHIDQQAPYGRVLRWIAVPSRKATIRTSRGAAVCRSGATGAGVGTLAATCCLTAYGVCPLT